MVTKTKSSRTAKKSKPTIKAKNPANFVAAFSALQKMLAPYETTFAVASRKPGQHWLQIKNAAYHGKPFPFAGVSMKKSYVSYHLMPIYVKPEIAKNISPALGKRRQGKSCFNFTAPDLPLFEELAAMTRAGFALFTQKGFLAELQATLQAGRSRK